MILIDRAKLSFHHFLTTNLYFDLINFFKILFIFKFNQTNKIADLLLSLRLEI